MANRCISARSDARFIRERGLAGEIADIAEPVIEDLGLRLVRVIVSGRDGGTIQVMVDHPEREVVVEDCARVSRALDPVIDAYAEKVRGAYALEVSSPGIDRPLVRPSDVARFVGQEAKIELREPVDGRKRFRGILAAFDEGELRLQTQMTPETGGKEQTVVLGFAAEMIEGAKLVLTDALIEEGARRAEEARRAQVDEAGDDQPDNGADE